MPSGLNTSSAIINGQLVPQTRSMLFTPLATGPVIQGVPASPPQSSGIGGAGPSMSDGSAMASANPWSPVHSPVPWLIAMFIVGYLMLYHIHWGY